MDYRTNRLESSQWGGHVDARSLAASARANLSSSFSGAAGSPSGDYPESSMTSPASHTAGDRRNPQAPSPFPSSHMTPCPGQGVPERTRATLSRDHSQPRTQSIGSVIAEVAAHRSHRRDPNHGHHETSDERLMAEPRTLRSEMDASASPPLRDRRDSSLVGSGGVRKRLELGGEDVEDGIGGTSDLSPENRLEMEEEQSTAILAVCRHGDTLGLAAVRGSSRE